jgi:outer membrane protein with beta-barrel domain
LSFAQDDCSVLLRRAQKYYDDGVIEEVPALLTNCLEDGFTKEEKVDAYKLLILCSIYEDDIDKADDQMLTFLKANPEYEINQSVDAAEFIHFFNSYKTSEIISFGFTAGTNFTNAYYMESFGTHNLNEYATSYNNSGFNFIVGPSFSRPIFTDYEIKLSILYAQKKYEFRTDFSADSYVETSETHNYLEFPLLVSYYKFGNKTFKPFVSAGLNTSYLIDAKAQPTITENNEPVTGPDNSIITSRNQLLFGAVLGAGLKIKLNKGSFHVFTKKKKKRKKNKRIK